MGLERQRWKVLVSRGWAMPSKVAAIKYPEMARKEISLSAAAHLQFPWYQPIKHVGVPLLVWVALSPLILLCSAPRCCAAQQCAFLGGQILPKAAAQHCPHPVQLSSRDLKRDAFPQITALNPCAPYQGISPGSFIVCYQ